MGCLLAQDACFRYAGRPVLRDVGLAVLPGKATVLVGPNGSGKTTLLWLLAGLLRPSAGSVGIADEPAGRIRRIDHARDRLGMVFQHSALWEHLTAGEHLALVLSGRKLPRAERRRRVEQALGQVQLSGLADRRPGQMSGGQQQRLAIARALVVRPQWLVLDEPLAHLDGPVRWEVFELLAGVLASRGAGVVLSTHEPSEALRLADEIVVLLDGQVAQSGPPRQVYRRPVSLAAAQILGPACRLAGAAQGGQLACDGRTILHDIDPKLRGTTELILRPEEIAFHADPSGAASVKGCQFTPGGYLLAIDVCGQAATVLSLAPVQAGATGRLLYQEPT